MQLNTVGFYQLSKICITPAVLVFDAVTSKIYPTRKEIAAVCVLCIGVTLATVADGSVSTNLVGFLIAIAAICTTAVYQVLLTTCQGICSRYFFTAHFFRSYLEVLMG